MKKSVSATFFAVFMLAVLATFGFTTTATAQRAGGGESTSAPWVIMTYVPGNSYTVPVPLPVTPLKGNGVSFDFYPTPDRAMLLSDISQSKQFGSGKLVGKTLSAQIAINASPGATFNYYNNDGTGNIDTWTSAGGFVRLYIQGVNPALTGCQSGWHPERPDCEAQYWWSNPLHIDLDDLAALGSKGITLQALLDPAVWSDRDGHMGTETIIGDITVNHEEAFNAAVANATKIGLSFGGNGWWAFGTGVNEPSTASFVLYKFVAK